MPLHPQAEAVIRAVESMGLPPFETMSLEEGRGVIQAFANFMPPKEEVASVVDTVVPAEETDIPLRIYTPEGDEELRPGILYFHGGGFSTGGIDLVDPVCAGPWPTGRGAPSSPSATGSAPSTRTRRR
jgi:acetyl esterase